jgi:acyl carrier protein
MLTIEIHETETSDYPQILLIVQEIISDQLSIKKDCVTAESLLVKDLGLDLMNGAELVSRFEEEFRIELEDSNLWLYAQCGLDPNYSVREITDLIYGKLLAAKKLANFTSGEEGDLVVEELFAGVVSDLTRLNAMLF